MSDNTLVDDNSCGEQSIKQYIDQRVEEAVDEATEPLREENERLRERVDHLETELADAKDSIDTNARNGALGRKNLRNRVVELQERELLKDAHLSVENLDSADVSEATEAKLGKVQKDEGAFWYVGDDAGSDPVEANDAAKADPRLSSADLLPVQQLASMDDDTLDRHSGTVADYWAARLWRQRGEKGSLWKEGSKSVKEYIDASDVAREIYIESDNVSRDSAREYARRAFRSLTDLSAGRTYTKQVEKRSDGLTYKETRLVLPTDAEIPGEPRAAAAASQSLGQHVENDPATDVVSGE